LLFLNEEVICIEKEKDNMVGRTLGKKVRTPLLAAFALMVLVMPMGTLAAEREGTTLFFSFEDLKQRFSHPALAPWPGFGWRPPQERAEQADRIERNYRWGNGLGFDSYIAPGARRPLWGY
jgi:hypothetical protein